MMTMQDGTQEELTIGLKPIENEAKQPRYQSLCDFYAIEQEVKVLQGYSCGVMWPQYMRKKWH